MEVKVHEDYTPTKDKQSAAYRLFHYHYMVNMYAADRLREVDHDVFGVVMPQDRKWAQDLAKAKDYQYLTPAEMAVVVTEGKYVSLCDPKDSVKIYKDIDRHLKDWLNELRHTLITDPPLIGLYEFDKLAELLVLIARGNGLVKDLKKYEGSDSRIFSSKRQNVSLGKVRHSGDIFNQILINARNAGIDIWQFRKQLDALDNENEETVTGSVKVKIGHRS